MKLYTEDQVKKIQQAILCNHKDAIMDENYCLNITKPIEIPSDEEIRKIMELDDMEFDEFDPYHLAHLEGAKWMRDKIQGGNNE